MVFTTCHPIPRFVNFLLEPGPESSEALCEQKAFFTHEAYLISRFFA